ncbi:MAG: sugar phosphate isomerase/epimerase [Gemmataceae bacterium]
MKIAVDSYCYHRQFGSHYPGLQKPARRRMSIWEFLQRAKSLRLQGVSIEACYLPQDRHFLQELREVLDRLGLERVWAWGHPEGLRSGSDRRAEKDLIEHIGIARQLGARVMRIVGGNRRTRPASWPRHRRRLLAALKHCVAHAEKCQVTLALENHMDLLADEILEILAAIGSPRLGVCLDTGNNLRIFEDPVQVARKLAPWVQATHIKDITAQPGDPRDFSFWPSVPLGHGLINIPEVLRCLQQARYHGLLAIEIDYLHPRYKDEDSAVQESVAYLRKCLRQLHKPRGPQAVAVTS